MRKYGLQELIAAHLDENRTLYWFTTVLFFIGIIFGAIIVNSLSLTQKHDLYMYLNQFFWTSFQRRVCSGIRNF